MLTPRALAFILSILTRSSGLLNFRSTSTPSNTGFLFASSKNCGNIFLIFSASTFCKTNCTGWPPRRFTEMVCSCKAKALPWLKRPRFLFTQFTTSCWLLFLSEGFTNATRTKPEFDEPDPEKLGAVMLTIYLFSGMESIKKEESLSMNLSMAS